MSSVIFPYLMAWEPALLLSMEYVNLGGWVGAIAAGASSGPYLLMLFLINCIAILCQHLATCIGVVTGKNLAQICSEEYRRGTCVLLGVGAELSMITSDLTMILTVAHGINLLFGLDLISCIIITSVVVVLFPLCVTILDPSRLEIFCSSVSGFTLLFYVLGMLLSQTEIQTANHHKHTRLSGETVCSIMALLGANIKPHSLYSHSSNVQKQRIVPNKTISAIIHDQIFAILYSSIGISLVNYMLMNLMADTIHDMGTLMPTYQDDLSLINQIFMSPLAPCPFFFVFLISSLITALTRNLSGQMVVFNFFGTELPIWVHDMIVKVLVIIPAAYCIYSQGDEGLYLMLLYSQLILAMLIPSTLIPLFRVSSTRSIMGAFKISWNLELLILFALSFILVLNIGFIIVIFGHSDPIDDASRGTRMLPSFILILMVFLCFCLTVHLIITPLKSPKVQRAEEMDLDFGNDQPQLCQSRGESAVQIPLLDEDEEVCNATPDYPLEEIHSIRITLLDEDRHVNNIQSDNLTDDSSLNLPDNIIDYDTNSQIFSPEPVHMEEEEEVHSQETKHIIDMGTSEVVEEVLSVRLMDGGVLRVEEETNAYTVKDDKQNGASQTFESSTTQISTASQHLESFSAPISAVPQLPSFSSTPTSGTSQYVQSYNNPIFEVSNASNNDVDLCQNKSNSSEKFVMTRAARRKLAEFLEEFWGHFFDYHGRLTDEAKYLRADLLLGLDIQITMSLKADNAKNYTSDFSSGKPEILPVLPSNSSASNVLMQENFHNDHDSRDVSLKNDTGDSLNDSSGNDLMGKIYTDLISSDKQTQSKLKNRFQSKNNKGAIIKPVSSNMDPVWAIQPLEQHFTPAVRSVHVEDNGEADLVPVQKKFLSYRESESIVIEYLRTCLAKILELEGSMWLFTQNGGYDEELVDRAAATEKVLIENVSKVNRIEGGGETDVCSLLTIKHDCGDSCVWQSGLVVSFGVWCICRIFELLVHENRPELWGKYTFVLNRLQGIIDPAFFQQRTPINPCECLEILKNHRNVLQNTSRSQFTTATDILGIMKELKHKLSDHKGRSISAGGISFNKGKENLFSVIKRYKRHLSSKDPI